MSVLSDRDIRAELEAGRVRIDPYDPADLQPSSVDLHLDRSFGVFRNNRYAYIDPRTPQKVTRVVIRTGACCRESCNKVAPERPGAPRPRSPAGGEKPHERRAASIRECLSLRTIWRRETSITPRSTRFRMVRDTVSRLEPIIWAIV